MAKKKGLDISKLAARLGELDQNNGGSGNGTSFVNIKDGKNQVRILPPTDDSDWVQEAWVHYGVGKTSNNTKGTMVVCPTTHGEKESCPICELSSELKKLSKKKDDKYDKEAKSVYRKKRVYFNAIDRADDLDNFELRKEKVTVDGKETVVEVWYNSTTGEKESPVKVLGVGIGVYKGVLKLITDPDYGDITDPEDGVDVIITKSGSGQFNTEYDVKGARNNSEVGFEEWEDCINDLSKFAEVKTYDELADLLDGKAPSEEEVEDGMSNLKSKSKSKDDEEEEDKPRRRSSKKDEDEEEEETDEGLEDEINAALARRKRK